MTVTGTQQRVYGILVSSCPCCWWNWKSGWVWYYSHSAFANAHICVGQTKYTYSNDEWDAETTFLFSPTHSTVESFEGKLSSECQLRQELNKCKKITTGFAGWFKDYNNPVLYNLIASMTKTTNIENVTSINIWLQCDYQYPGWASTNLYINGTLTCSASHLEGWKYFEIVYETPITITSFKLERTSSISYYGFFTINFHGLKINNRCIDFL